MTPGGWGGAGAVGNPDFRDSVCLGGSARLGKMGGTLKRERPVSGLLCACLLSFPEASGTFANFSWDIGVGVPLVYRRTKSQHQTFGSQGGWGKEVLGYMWSFLALRPVPPPHSLGFLDS